MNQPEMVCASFWSKLVKKKYIEKPGEQHSQPSDLQRLTKLPKALEFCARPYDQTSSYSEKITLNNLYEVRTKLRTRYVTVGHRLPVSNKWVVCSPWHCLPRMIGCLQAVWLFFEPAALPYCCFQYPESSTSWNSMA